jgi:hypothetical protein
MSANRKRLATVLIGALLTFPWASRARAEAAGWKPKYPVGQALDPTTLNSQFWPILLERLCTGTNGTRRTDRGSCADDTDKNGNPIPGTLPSDPTTALSRIFALLDDSILGSVQVKAEKTKIISLQKQAPEGILSQIQPANDATPGTQGTPAQTDAVPSIQPVSQASANAALAATRAGERVFASVAVNPAGIFTTSTTDPAQQAAGATYTRVADLSLILPINPAGSTTGSGGLGSFDYVGFRLRVNATGLFKDSLYGLATKKVDATFKSALAAEGQVDNKIGPLLAAFDPSACAASYLSGAKVAPDCSAQVQTSAATFASRLGAATACAEAIVTALPTNIEAACNQSLDVFDNSRKAEAALHAALATLRDQYDADYIGLDARYDFGDPTFSGLAIARGSHLLAALAFGHRFLLGDADAGSRHPFFGLKARLGYQLTSLNDNMDRTGSLDFAGGIETGIINNLQVFKISAGAEGRHTWSTVPTAADTNFVDIKIGIDIPQSDGTRLGALLSLPTEGSHGTTLSLVGNWSALTGALSPH